MYSRKVSSKGKTIKLKTLNNKDSEGLGCRLLYSYKHQVSFYFQMCLNTLMNVPDTTNTTCGWSGSQAPGWLTGNLDF